MENQENKPEKKTGWRGPEELANRGRVVGSKNKATQAIRIAYQKLTEDNLENMSEWIRDIAQEDPAKAFELMIKLSEYVIPKLGRTELTGAGGDDLFKNVTFQFGTPINEREIDITDVDWEEPNPS